MSDKIKQDISIGANMRQLRQNADMTQDAVAAQLQVMGLTASREIVSQMELGRYSVRVSVLLALCELYNASISDFFDGLSLKV